MPTWLLIVVVSIALLGFWVWLGRPNRHRARAGDFERFIEGLTQQFRSGGHLFVQHAPTGATAEFAVYRSRTDSPSLLFKLRAANVTDDAAGRIVTYCRTQDLGSLQRAKTRRAEILLRVRIPKCSPARAAELARFAFCELGAGWGDEYRFHYQGPLHPRRARDLFRRKAV